MPEEIERRINALEKKDKSAHDKNFNEEKINGTFGK